MNWIGIITRELLWGISVVGFFVLCVIGFVLVHPMANPGLIEFLLRDLFLSPPINAFQFSLLIWILANYAIRFLTTWALDRFTGR
jgi:hypothetical protein